MGEPWDPENCEYNRTVTGWLGNKRSSMLSNVLLARDTVGKCITRGTKLPPGDNTFGMVLTDRSRTVQQALQGWGAISVPDDHLTTNRKLLRKRQHRKKDILETDEFERPPTPNLNPNQVYGLRPRYYRETIEEVLANKFQKEFIEETKSGSRCYVDPTRASQQKDRVRLKLGQVYENRACQLRKSAKFDEVAPKEPWRMRRFLDVDPHLSTFRSPRALTRARKADLFESTGREGMWGHGITSKAKSLI